MEYTLINNEWRLDTKQLALELKIGEKSLYNRVKKHSEVFESLGSIEVKFNDPQIAYLNKEQIVLLLGLVTAEDDIKKSIIMEIQVKMIKTETIPFTPYIPCYPNPWNPQPITPIYRGDPLPTFPDITWTSGGIKVHAKDFVTGVDPYSDNDKKDVNYLKIIKREQVDDLTEKLHVKLN